MRTGAVDKFPGFPNLHAGADIIHPSQRRGRKERQPTAIWTGLSAPSRGGCLPVSGIRGIVGSEQGSDVAGGPIDPRVEIRFAFLRFVPLRVFVFAGECGGVDEIDVREIVTLAGDPSKLSF